MLDRLSDSIKSVTGSAKGVFGRALGVLVDPTIVASFDATGYRIHSLRFDPTDLDVSMAGEVCLVTGANSGIGLATTRALAERGATVWMVCRNEERGRQALGKVQKETGNDDLHLGIVDVSCRDSIRRFLAEFDAPQLDVLVHNAGVLPAERQESPQGIELTLATHVVGPLKLTVGLLPKLAAAQHSRIIFVSSGGMYTQRLELEDLNWERTPYDGVIAYAQTKRAQVILSEMLAERLADSGIVSHAMHPGWADTPAVRSSLPRFWKVMKNRLRTPEQGADTVIWLAVSEQAGQQTGKFWFDRQPRWTHYLPTTRESEQDRRRLWDRCLELAGETEEPFELAAD